MSDEFADRFFDWAARAGVALSPLAPNAKTPISESEHPTRYGSNSRADWQQWREAGNNFALAAAPNSLIIIDVDPRNGGHESWAAWQAQNAHFDIAWISQSGGAHILFRTPPNCALTGRKLGPGIDSITGGYVVCPPSTIDGRRYLMPRQAIVHAPPAALIEHLSKASRAERVAEIASPGDYDAGDVAKMVEFLHERGAFADYGEWVSLGMALKLCLGDLGFEIWESVFDGDVTTEIADSKWRSFSSDPAPGSVTLASWMKQAHGGGWRGTIRKTAAAMFEGVAGIADAVGGRSLPVPTPKGTPMIGGPAPQIVAPEYGETEIADRFVKAFGCNLSHIKSRKQWLYWNGKRWCIDETGHVADFARQHCQAESALCSGTPGYTAANARSVCSAKSRSAVLTLAADDQRIATRADDWDADRFLLGTPDGIVELRTGTLRAARPDDRVTKSTAIAPAGDCPTWLAFLARATGGNVELQTYLQRLCGYALTGETKEESLHFAYGPGGAGKGTFVHAVSGVLGDYHTAIPIATLTESKQDRHLAELAVLQGARLVTCSETERGRQWAESRIKELTGNDVISARFMHGNPFNFVPTFKLLISGNYKPHLRPDSAMQRRFQLIPFDTTIPKDEVDRDLGKKLRCEWPGILAWMIAGCLLWQRDTLAPPKTVVEATAQYMEEEADDCLSAWLHECCEVDPLAKTPHNALYSSYRNYAERAGERPTTSAQLGKDLKRLGHDSARDKHARFYCWIKIDSAADVQSSAERSRAMTNETQKAILDVMARFPDLTVEGLGGNKRPNFDERRAELLSPFGIEEFEIARAWLLYVPKRAPVNRKFDSYRIKHVIEKWFGVYVGNGPTIAAAIAVGIEIARCPSGINAWLGIAGQVNNGSNKMAAMTG